MMSKLSEVQYVFVITMLYVFIKELKFLADRITLG